MYTISDIMADISRGCAANNLNEDAFSYRIVFFVNEGDAGRKHYADSAYGGLRETLEGIIRKNLSLENTLVVAQTTIRKGGHCVCLQSRAYSFSLEGYFKQLSGKSKDGIRKRNMAYVQAF